MISPLVLDIVLAVTAVTGMALVAFRKGGGAAALVDVVDARGIVPGDPDALANAAGVSLNVYALARLGQSEESGTLGRTAVMCAAMNAAREKGQSIASLLLHSTDSEADGHFGEQAGRFAATSKAPTAATIEIARKVYAGTISDPTFGATRWDAPKTQQKMHEKNPTKYRTPEEIAERRRSEGYEELWVTGLSSTRFWRA